MVWSPQLRQEVLKVLCFAFASFIISNLLFSYSHFIFYFSVESLLQKLEEANNEKEVIKKKNASFIKVVTFFVNSYGDSGDRFRCKWYFWNTYFKELRAELRDLRKKKPNADASPSELREPENICVVTNGSNFLLFFRLFTWSSWQKVFTTISSFFSLWIVIIFH